MVAPLARTPQDEKGGKSLGKYQANRTGVRRYDPVDKEAWLSVVASERKVEARRSGSYAGS